MIEPLIKLVLEKVAAWTPTAKEAAEKLRLPFSTVFTSADVGIYVNPEENSVGYFAPKASSRDVSFCKVAMQRAGISCPATSLGLSDLAGPWVKVAFSRTLRNIGEATNFLPGQYPWGTKNNANPLAASLTGGLVGAGIGYGAGKLIQNIAPGWVSSRLARTLAAAGGAAGASPGLMWMYSAKRRGLPITENHDIPPQGEKPVLLLEDDWQKMLQTNTNKQGNDSFYSQQNPVDTIAINTNKLQQTLWEVDASPQTAAATMGALHIAAQFPDPRAAPGYVTPHQVGLLGTALGAAGGGLQGYATGLVVGKTLNLLTGLPATRVGANAGAVLGIINSVVPRLYR